MAGTSGMNTPAVDAFWPVIGPRTASVASSLAFDVGVICFSKMPTCDRDPVAGLNSAILASSGVKTPCTSSSGFSCRAKFPLMASISSSRSSVMN